MIAADVIHINLMTLLVLVLASSLLLLLGVFTFMVLLRASSKYRKSLKEWIAEVEEKKTSIIEAIEKQKLKKPEETVEKPAKNKKKVKEKIFNITHKLLKKPEPTVAEEIVKHEPTEKKVKLTKAEMKKLEEDELEMLTAAALAIHIEMHLHQQPAVLTQLDFGNAVNHWAFASRPVVNLHFENLLPTRNSINKM